MELKQYLSVVWKWLWLIVVSTVIAGAASYYATSQQPKTYQATATVIVGRGLESINPSAGELGTSTQLAQTYVQIARTTAVLKGTIEATGLKISPEALRGGISVSIIPGTQLIEIRVFDIDPVRAAALANELAHQLTLQGPSAEERDFAMQREFVQQQVEELRQKIQSAQDRIESLRASMQSTSSARELADLQDQINTTQAQIEQWRTSYSQLLNLMSPRSPNYVSVLDPAQVPTRPTGPNLSLNVMLAAAVGFILSLAAAFLFEYLDDTFKTGDDVERYLQLTPVGVIAQMAGGKGSRLVTASEPRSLISEAYRVLRTNIQFSGLDRPIKLILVTSASPMEGKSVTTANVAVVMAQAGLRTLLLDGDLRKPSQHKLFEVTNDFGLTNALLSQNSPESFIRPTRVDNLRLMTTGPLPPNPAEILSSERMKYLINQLANSTDIIVIDSPPALPVADAAILTRLSDGVLLVVDANRTRRDPARRAKATIENAGGHILGVVLNRISHRASGYYYYYRGYYSQEGGSSHAQTAGAAAPQTGLGRLFSTVTRR